MRQSPPSGSVRPLGARQPADGRAAVRPKRHGWPGLARAVPLDNQGNFVDVSGDIVDRVEPVFFSDPMTAAMKAIGLT
ncbi:MAG TPA: hypothetical protein VFA18_11620 [Gemmataceae bacterium]|nr:hypothetical protein [Gemmataceae bacterium]